MNQLKKSAVLACLMTLLLTAPLAQTGCRKLTNSNVYAADMYPAKYMSINGLGVFERMCKQGGSSCVDVTRLSSRLERMEAIILIGDTLRPPAKEARDWLEEWLARKPGRTVVYVGRDFDAEIYYRQQTIDQGPVAEQAMARIDLAEAHANADARLWRELDDDVFCRWFTVVTQTQEREVTKFQGDWAESLDPQPDESQPDDPQPDDPQQGDPKQGDPKQGDPKQGDPKQGDPKQGESQLGESKVRRTKPSWPVRVLLQPPSKTQPSKPPTWKAPKIAKTTAPTVNANTNSSSGAPKEQVVVLSHWSQYDIADDETWTSEWKKAPDAETLLAGEDGTPLITRLTSERFEGSHILIVANGAPFLNASLIRPHFRKIARRIIQDIQPAKRVALFPFREQGILISRLTQDEDDAVGLTVLTTWPMNIIVAHLTLLGILVCFALFPILGRPQALKRRSLADFGQHAVSLGQMLQRAGDLRYAYNQVSNYYKKVRGEAVPYWVAQAIQLDSSGVPIDSQAPATTQVPTEQ